MKALTLATLISLAFASSLFAQTTDSVYYEMKSNGVWQKSQLDIKTTDASCKLISLLSLIWDEGSASWINSFLSTYTYSNTNTNSAVLQQNWDANRHTWVNYGKATFVYGKGGLRLTYTYQSWDSSSNGWVNSLRLLEDFDEMERVISTEIDFYSTQWDKNVRSLNSYDSRNRITIAIYQDWINNLWTNQSKTTYSFTGSGVMLNYTWNSTNHEWEKFSRTFNKYLDSTSLSLNSLQEIISGSTWQKSLRGNSTYNSHYFMLSNFWQIWDTTMSSWVNASKLAIDYYADNNPHNLMFETWDRNTSSWNSGYRTTSTDIYCTKNTQVEPIAEIRTINGSPNKNGSFSFSKINAKNTIQRSFNPILSKGDNIVYHFTITDNEKQPKQHMYELILAKAVKHKAINSKTYEAIPVTNKRSFILSPNPAKNYFDINLSSFKDARNIILRITNITGKVLMQQKMLAKVQQLNVSALQKGMYIVSIITEKEIQTGKLLVE